jgi:hypothetical protein
MMNSNQAIRACILPPSRPRYPIGFAPHSRFVPRQSLTQELVRVFKTLFKISISIPDLLSTPAQIQYPKSLRTLCFAITEVQLTQSSSTNQGERPQQRLVPVGPSHMHLEGWIFDVEMLMLTEYARIHVEEVPVGWREVKGSKLNAIWDSLGRRDRQVEVLSRHSGTYTQQSKLVDHIQQSRNPRYPYGTSELSEYTRRSLFT